MCLTRAGRKCPGLGTADFWTSVGFVRQVGVVAEVSWRKRSVIFAPFIGEPEINPFLCLCRSRFVNFRNNPLTLNVTLASTKTRTLDGQEEDEDDREMFGREFMLTYIQEARKRSQAVLHMHRVSAPTWSQQ